MKFLKNLFSELSKDSSTKPKLKQPESEAVIDLMLLGIYGDDHFSLSESRELDAISNSLAWKSNQDLSVYIDNAVVRVRNARLSDEATDEFIQYIARRLTSPGAKEYALELLNRLLRSDGKNEVEKVLFKKIEAIFKVT